MSMRRIKVLIVAGTMNVGGVENQLMHLLRHADRVQFQIDFTTTTQHPFYEDEILALGGKCISIPPTGGRHLLRYYRALRRVIRSGGYDIVHTNELFHSGLVALTARLSGVKHCFIHAHSCNQPAQTGWARRCYIRFMRFLILHCGTVYLACSSPAAEFLYGPQIPGNSKYHLIVNSVETERFLPDNSPAVPESGEKPEYTVLQVGRFGPEKNFMFTTGLAAACKKRGLPIRFLLVGNDGGENPVERAVRARIQRDGLEDCVRLLGIRKDVDALMKSVDAFLLPSIYEGMPLTLIEAQAACLPCLAADTFSHEVDFGVGAVRWLRLDAPLDDWVDALERAVKAGRTDPAAVRQAIIEKSFDVTCFAKKLCDLYQQAVSEG